MPRNLPDERWLDQQELADRLKIPIATVRDWRLHGYGPPGVRFGRGKGGSVRYRLSKVEQFERETEAQQAAGGAA